MEYKWSTKLHEPPRSGSALRLFDRGTSDVSRSGLARTEAGVREADFKRAQIKGLKGTKGLTLKDEACGSILTGSNN